ncbi:winged helix-turn-helix domain-containing protein [Candidatus Enterococcus ferrettii]|uniref:OmpR/PhoB-type domain-containing protein n=1 Tax=Candidatus Enterococcus ferrettii TaxID=2815324 RepID=A0ABV0ELM5_9ENTE|nr:winged helix-turn-helix domain-containing protein [Enterococcus sp. 665A]MBO1342162.1 winged helix-turn-helix domain-containing protein [Enterococcus sp. 665A]
MVQIMILTENIANETYFYEKLQRLNHEAFVSCSVLNSWRSGQKIDSWIKNFSLLVISETIADNDALKLLDTVKKHDIFLLRKLDEYPLKEEKSDLELQGFYHWIFSQASLTELRESLFFLRELDQTSLGQHLAHDDAYLQNTLTIFREKLPPINRQIFLALEKQNGQVISREQLSTQIWGYCNRSSLSQLSSRMKTIKQTIFEEFSYDHAICTEWKNGYSFSNSFYQEVIKKVIAS